MMKAMQPGNGMNCPLCEGTDVRGFDARAHDSSVAGKTVAIRACQICDFAWQWPLDRTPGQSKEIFQQEYQAERKGGYFDKDLRSAIASCQFDFVAGLDVQTRTLLDIGCGDGAFARECAKRGWQVMGIDPALPDHLAELHPSGHFGLVKGMPEDLGLGREFACVTLWDVVEHLPDPRPVLQTAWDLLAPGGWLVLETGNYQSAGRLLAGDSWWAWQLDHRWYFSPPTLRVLLEPLGYSELRVADRVLRPWSRALSRIDAPSRAQTLLSLLKRPWRAAAIRSEHAAKREASTRWPQWASLEIFALAIRK